jgi:hypothetical protein
MGRGLGKHQQQVLWALRTHGPMTAVDLAELAWRSCGDPGGSRPTDAFYDVLRQAAALLVKRGLLRVGRPKYRRRAQRSFSRVVFWLPEHEPPELMESLPVGAEAVRAQVLDILNAGPLPYAKVASALRQRMAKNRLEWGALNTATSRAIARLQAEERIIRWREGAIDMLSVRA